MKDESTAFESTNNGIQVEAKPNTEVVARAERRRYTAEYKLRILREVEACRGSGEIGALLRREGLYSSNLTKWRQQRERGELDGLAPRVRGPKEDPQAVENAQLKREIERLREELRKAQLIIEVQKKVSQILGVPPAEQGPQDETQ
jgi:transposase